MFNSRIDALKFEDKLMSEFLIKGKREENYISDEVIETFYYCDKDVLIEHKKEMEQKGWAIDVDKGVKEIIYTGTGLSIEDEWSYDRLVYKKHIN